MEINYTIARTMPSGDTTLGVGEQLKLLEDIITKLVYRDLVTAAPPQCSKPSNIKAHTEEMEKFYKAKKITDDDTKVSVLLNSISEEMRLEICCQVGFEANETNYEWIKNKLIEVFHQKESEITPLIKLYSIKQRSNQTLRDFLSEVRIEGYKLLKDVNATEREKYLLDVFAKGLRNKEVRAALNVHKVGSLDDAYKLIKKKSARKANITPDT